MDEERAVSLVSLRGYTVDEMVHIWLHAHVEHPSNLQENRTYHALAKSERKCYELACGAELCYMQRRLRCH